MPNFLRILSLEEDSVLNNEEVSIPIIVQEAIDTLPQPQVQTQQPQEVAQPEAPLLPIYT